MPSSPVTSVSYTHLDVYRDRLGGNYNLSSNYGWRWGRLHSGQDMACPTGTPVRSISSGVVIFSGWAGNLGYKVEILHWDGTVSWYGHNSNCLLYTSRCV